MSFPLDCNELATLENLATWLAQRLQPQDECAQTIHEYALILLGLRRLPRSTVMLVTLTVDEECGPDASRYHSLTISEEELEASTYGTVFGPAGGDRYTETAWRATSSGDSYGGASDLSEWIWNLQHVVSAGARIKISDEWETWGFPPEDEEDN